MFDIPVSSGGVACDGIQQRGDCGKGGLYMETSRYEIMLLFLAVYMGVMVFIGLKTNKWSSKASSYLVAGRGAGAITTAFALVAIIAAGTTFSGATGLGYTMGMPGAIWTFSWCFAVLLGAMFFVRLGRATGCYSIAEWAGVRFDDKVRYAMVVPQGIASILSGAAQIVGSAFILTGVIGCSYLTAVSISGIIVLVYAYLGGQWAVTLTSFLQVILCALAVIITVAWLAGSFGGWSTLVATLPPHFFTYPGKLGWGCFDGNWGLLTQLGLIVGFFLIVVPNTYVWTRTAATRTAKSAQRGYLLAAVLALILFAWLIAVVGMYAKSAGFQSLNPNAIYGVVLSSMPAGMTGFILVGILAAIMSTASMAIMGADVTFTRDIYQPLHKMASDKQVTKWARLITVFCWIGVFTLSVLLEGHYWF